MDKREQQAASMQDDSNDIEYDDYVRIPPLYTVQLRMMSEERYEQLQNAAATIENIYSLAAMLARDLPPNGRFPEVYAIIELVEQWRERAREAGRDD